MNLEDETFFYFSPFSLYQIIALEFNRTYLLAFILSMECIEVVMMCVCVYMAAISRI